jgi:hypothetical protein
MIAQLTASGFVTEEMMSAYRLVAQPLSPGVRAVAELMTTEGKFWMDEADAMKKGRAERVAVGVAREMALF